MRIKMKYIIITISLLITASLFYVNIKMTNLKQLTGSIIIWASKENFRYLNDSAKEFMNTNKKVTITVKEKSEDEVINYMEAGNASLESPSVVTINSRDLRNLNDAGKSKINDAGDIMNEYGKNFNSWRINEVTINNDVLAVPLENDPVFLFFRKDILEEYGYKAENIRTWKELLDISRDIKNRSQGTVSLFNYSDITLESIKNIMFYQQIEADKVNEIIDTIKNDNLMGKGAVIAHVATKDNYKTIIDEYPENSLTAAMLPSLEIGGNRAAVMDGEDVAIIKNSNETNELAISFITFSVSNQTLMEKYLKESDFFPSSTAFYKNSIIDTDFSKVNNEKIWSLMVNICNRNNAVQDYKKLEENIK
ncbi:MAG: ABC transporter substrate-binding protein [Clostridiaceae bacterium]